MTDRFTNPYGYTGKRHKGTRIGTLWADLNAVDGDVTLAPVFDDLGKIAKLDLLGDVIGLLQREYDAIMASNPYGSEE